MQDEKIAAGANLDRDTVAGFGDEWTRFDQRALDDDQRQRIFDDYFRMFPWETLPHEAVGADIGCGSGRWALLVAPRVGHLHLVDANAAALNVARAQLGACANVSFHQASVDTLPFPDGSLDFAYSLGVLHHVPDTADALRTIARKLKPGAPLQLYLYYAFDNRPLWFRILWRSSDYMRRLISRLPFSIKYWITQVIALVVYWPLARLALLLKRFDVLPATWPLAYYADKTFYIMRTDALDRFWTRPERRFTKNEIRQMLEVAGCSRIQFSDHPPYWSVVSERT